ncbi:MAG TPA: hypothetical protein PLW68_12385 [Casimicrobiaceae bacterium]|nr:hypothetical protein [Casimicrobiaceae bacterium]
MKSRTYKLAIALVAAAMHIVAPGVAYAGAAKQLSPGDLCSAARPAPPDKVRGGAPLPASHEHHCAHAPCCGGGAGNAAAPPPTDASLRLIAVASAGRLATVSTAAPAAPIRAARPRGPPRQY